MLYCLSFLAFKWKFSHTTTVKVSHNFLQSEMTMSVVLNIRYVSNETNTDVRMYTCRIYSSRDLDTLLYKLKI